MPQPPQVPSKSPVHILSNPTLSMDFRRCSCHEKMLEYYCVDDAAYPCDYCIPKLLGGHQVKSLDEASMKKEELLKELSASESEAEDRIQGLKKEGRLLQLEADGLSKKVSVVFQDMRKHMDVLERNVLSEIFRQLEQTSAPCHDEIQKLEAKKEELSRKMATFKELCTTSDLVTVLKKLEPEDGGRNHQETIAAHELDEGLISEMLHSGFAELVTIAYKGLFMNKESDILLDENTAGNNILVLPDMKSFYWVETHQTKPKTPQRFKDHQVLSSSSFSTGRHFWTVETSKWGNWRIGMSYPSIARKGFRSYIGCNNKSWALCKWDNQYSAMHACKEIKLPNKFTCQALGVYLDYEAGHLSFYELSDTIRHLHTFNATFTKPLHAVFRLWLDSYGGAWMILKNRGRPVDGTVAEAAKGAETFHFVN